MVNKIAVMAVVLIVAVPILLGYGLAFEEVEKTTWNESNTRSITSVLYNDTKYSDVALNSYSINSKIIEGKYYPEYVKIASSPATSIPLARESFSSSTTFVPNSYGIGNVFFDGQARVNATINYTSGGVPTSTTLVINCMAFNGTTVSGTYYSGSPPPEYEYTDVTSVTFDNSYTVQYEVSSGSYADITYGWKLNPSLYIDSYSSSTLKIGTFTKCIITLDVGDLLENISPGGSKAFDISSSGDRYSEWVIIGVMRGSSPGESKIIFSGRDAEGQLTAIEVPLNDTDFSQNVFQLVYDVSGMEIRYIGSWPNAIGTAPSLGTWYLYNYYNPPTYLDTINIGLSGSDSPIFRFDTAIREGFASPVITDKTYDPSGLLPDQTTGSYSMSLADIGYIGTSIGWGGETFDVKNGALIVDNKKIPLSNLKLESRYLDGVRTNYINGKEISTGANTLQLNGTWGAIVSLTELTPETSTSNEWQPGEFAWNGVDSSFALMGLIASVGVFVGLGMYGARSGAKVGMLMLICGGAALIFLALI